MKCGIEREGHLIDYRREDTAASSCIRGHDGLHFEPFLDALSLRSDVIRRMKILSLRRMGFRLDVYFSVANLPEMVLTAHRLVYNPT